MEMKNKKLATKKPSAGKKRVGDRKIDLSELVDLVEELNFICRNNVDRDKARVCKKIIEIADDVLNDKY